MGMPVVPTTINVGQIGQTLDEDGQPQGEGGGALERSMPQFADDLTWWAEAAKAQREKKPLSY